VTKNILSGLGTGQVTQTGFNITLVWVKLSPVLSDSRVPNLLFEITIFAIKFEITVPIFLDSRYSDFQDWIGFEIPIFEIAVFETISPYRY
jgi:hypothetical protein